MSHFINIFFILTSGLYIITITRKLEPLEPLLHPTVNTNLFGMKIYFHITCYDIHLDDFLLLYIDINSRGSFHCIIPYVIVEILFKLITLDKKKLLKTL